MQKAVILYNHKKEIHMKLLEEFLLLEAHQISFFTVDMASAGMLHEKYLEILKASPDFILSFDLAGMELRTDMDTATLNHIPIRMAHILLDTIESYRQWLGERFNFSMFFYGSRELCRRMRLEYPDIPNIRELPPIFHGDESVRKDTLNSFLHDFLKEAELLQGKMEKEKA